jgi:hypothetical protein
LASTNQKMLSGNRNHGHTVERRAWTGTIFVTGSPERTQTVG